MSLQINPLTSNHSIRIIIPRFNAIMWRFRVNCYARSTNPYGTRLKIVTARYFWNVSTIVLPQIPLLGKRCSPKQYQRRSDKVNRNCFSFPQRFAVLFSWLHFLRQINSSLFCLKRHSAIWNIYKTNVYYGNCVYVSKEGLFFILHTCYCIEQYVRFVNHLRLCPAAGQQNESNYNNVLKSTQVERNPKSFNLLR